MLFRKKDALVGLDIGSRSVKVAEIAEFKNGPKLKRFAMADIPAGAIEDGVVSDPDTVAETIRQLFKSNQIKETNVAVSIGGYSVIVKKVSVQTMTEEQLHETIHFEAEQYIPFDISDVNLDFQILGPNENNPSQMNVFLVAAKREMINDYINLVTLAGLNPCIIDIEAFALQNIFEANYDIRNENIALIDIGASKTSLNIIKDESSVFMRDVALGCLQVNQKIMSLLNCSYDEAELIKLGEPSKKISAAELQKIVGCGGRGLVHGNPTRPGLLLHELPRRPDQTDHPERRRGECRGVSRKARRRVLGECRDHQPVQKVYGRREELRPGIHPPNRPPGGHRHGVGHEKSGRQMIRINLLPFRSSRKKENVRRQLSIFLLSVILVVVGIFGGNLLLSNQIDSLNQRITTASAELEKYDSINREIEEIKRKLENLNKKMDIIRELEASRYEPVRLMDAMTKVTVEKRMWFTHMDTKTDVINISGNAMDDKTVADFMVRLEGCGLFSAVSLKTLKQIETAEDDAQEL